MGRDVLGSEGERDLVGVDERLDRAEGGERREQADLDGVGLVTGILEGPVQLLHEGHRLQVVEVHLPVAGDERGAGVCDRAASVLTPAIRGPPVREVSCPRGIRGSRHLRWRCGRNGRRRSRAGALLRPSRRPDHTQPRDLRQRLGDTSGAGGEGGHLEHAHRAVPEDRPAVGDEVGEERGGVGADVQAEPIGAERRLFERRRRCDDMVGIGGERGGDHRVDGKHQLDAASAGIGDVSADGVGDPPRGGSYPPGDPRRRGR